MRKNAKEFLEIKAAQWSTLVGKPTRYDVRMAANHCVPVTPSSEHVLLFSAKTTELLAQAIEAYEENPTSATYRELQKITIVKAIAFNRHRGQDVTSLDVVEYTKAKRAHLNSNTEIINTFSASAKENYYKYQMVETLGKC